MKSFSLLALVLTLGLSLASADADAAKRFGGGKTSGMQRQTTTEKSTATSPASTAPTTAASAAKAPTAAAAATPPKRSWMGPLAGLAAGLGLAALASHLGFGEEMASMLMIGLLVMGVLMVVGFVMRKRAAAQPGRASGLQYAAAGPSAAPQPNRFDAAMPASGIGSAIGANLAPQRNIPADFDVAGFARNAKVNFLRLQAANDAGDLADIRQFTTPEMFAEIQLELSERGGQTQQTRVLHVDADVLEVAQEDGRHVVSVRFQGQVQEDAGAAPEAFDEIWHLTKPQNGAGGWVIAGIQQVQ